VTLLCSHVVDDVDAGIRLLPTMSEIARRTRFEMRSIVVSPTPGCSASHASAGPAGCRYASQESIGAYLPGDNSISHRLRQPVCAPHRFQQFRRSAAGEPLVGWHHEGGAEQGVARLRIGIDTNSG